MFTPARSIGLKQSNTGVQNSDAWDAFMASLPTTDSAWVLFENGTYNWARQIDVIRKVRISGTGGGPHSPGTFFSWPKDSHGIYLHSYATYSGVSSQDRADGAVVEHLRIQANGKGKIRHAIVVKAPVTLQNLYMENWSGDGVHINAGLFASRPSSESLSSFHRLSIANCGRSIAITSLSRTSNVVTVTCATPHQFEATAPNETIFWLNNAGQPYCIPGAAVDGFELGVKGGIFNIVSSTVFQYNEVGADGSSSASGWDVRTGNGAYIHGGDANASDFTGFSVTGCKCWAIFEDSQLGNHHQAHHCDSNELGAYYANQPAGLNTWIGCYSEQNNPCSYLSPPSVVIGGDHGATEKGNPQAWSPRGLENMSAVVRNNGAPGSNEVGRLGLGCAPTSNHSYLAFEVAGNVHSQHVSLNKGPFYFNGWTGNWVGWDYDYGGYVAFMVALDSCVAPNGRLIDGGRIALRDGFHMPNGSFWTEASAAPTTGKWTRGDRVWHSTPAVGQPQGWVCTVSGDFAATPPTFVAMSSL